MRVNEQISAPQVRVIDSKGEQVGVMDTQAALKLASEQELDLVEVAPNATPPVCRIMDYGKFKYEREKQEKEAKKKQQGLHLKEVRMRPKIDEHDYQFKLRHLKEFLSKRNRVKVSIIFRGRENVHKEAGERLMQQILEDVADLASLDGSIRSERNSLIATLVPK
ncbi:MAG: translation initiation factor IF-3 [Candidatus Latescibacterota bacterium]|nr:MAG: translation initiation factor IF-3 [Candidatus Latescibacterota bacterium]RKY71016.1 MAG: translation initiation factor IF-3 [Candidatus Latescibacterota bacterium]